MKRGTQVLIKFLLISLIIVSCGGGEEAGEVDVVSPDSNSDRIDSSQETYQTISASRESTVPLYVYLPNGKFTLVSGEEDLYGFYLNIDPESYVDLRVTSSIQTCPDDNCIDMVESYETELCIYESMEDEGGNLIPYIEPSDCVDPTTDFLEVSLKKGFYFIGLKSLSDPNDEISIDLDDGEIVNSIKTYYYALESRIEPGEDQNNAYKIDQPFSGVFKIEDEWDSDYFSIDLTDIPFDISAKIEANCVDSNLDISFCLYDSENNIIGNDGECMNESGGGEDEIMDVTLTKSEIYYLMVAGENYSTGKYAVKFSTTPIISVIEDPGDDFDSAESISYPYNNTFAIETESDQDYFEFTVDDQSDISIMVETENLDSELDVILCLYDSSHNYIGNNEGCKNDSGYGEDEKIIRTLEEESQYYILIEGNDYYSTGSYRLRLNSIEDPGDGFEAAKFIGIPFEGNFAIAENDGSADVDFFKFELINSSEITIDLESDDSATICFYNELFAGEGDCEEGVPYTALLDPGEYFFQVNNDYSYGEYTLSIDTISGYSAETAQMLIPPFYGKLSINQEDEKDYRSIYLDEEEEVYFSLYVPSNNSNSNPELALLDFEEKEVVLKDHTLEKGLYYLEVSENGYIGDYFLYYGNEPADYYQFASPITLGSKISQSIDKTSDIDFFSFELTKSTELSIEHSGDIAFNLYKKSANQLYKQSSHDSKQTYLSEDKLSQGTYVIEVYGLKNATGNYSFTVSSS